MKLLYLLAGLLTLGAVTPPIVFAQETLTVSFTTSDGRPREYFLVVWVENDQGEFVDTLGLWAGRSHRDDLRSWTAASGVVDAVTGATQMAHVPRTVQWDMRAFDGSAAGEGEFVVRMELAFRRTPRHANARFRFLRNGSPSSQTGLMQDGFLNVSLEYSGRTGEDVGMGADGGDPGQDAGPRLSEPSGGCSTTPNTGHWPALLGLVAAGVGYCRRSR